VLQLLRPLVPLSVTVALLGEHAAVDLLSVHQIFIFICLVRVLASYQVLILVREHISLALFLEISHSWLWAAI